MCVLTTNYAPGGIECKFFSAAFSSQVAVQALAHAGYELERHGFEYTNGREELEANLPPPLGRKRRRRGQVEGICQ